jgi:catabolite repression HPr-like protein
MPKAKVKIPKEDSIMTQRDITVRLDSGLENRPIAFLVQVASQFRSDIYLISGSKRVNAKSIMGMMSLGLIAGEDVTVTAEGSDEHDAVSKIEKFLTKAD